MKLTTILPLCLSSLAAANYLSGGQTPMAADIDVPGDNPMKYCPAETLDDDILAIDHVDLSPNPPAPGQTLTIEAEGTFAEKIEEGAFVWLTVKYGLIRLIYQKEDLCEQMKQVDTECPLGPGVVKITKDVDIPQQVPPGKYFVQADVYTKDEKKITCLTASISFTRPKIMGF